MNKENFRASRYLNIIDLDDGQTSLLFNGVNACMDEVPNELAAILAAGGQTAVSALARPNLEFLSKRGHITTLKPEAELERFRELVSAIHARLCSETTAGGLLLLFSYDCNLACSYCYQQKHRQTHSGTRMTLEMVDAIFEKHLPDLLPGMTPSQLLLYGGEPFLPANLPVIRRALEHAKKHGLQVEAITNATRLDSMMDIFGPEPGLVGKVQISLDGHRELHDRSRVPLSGTPTFDKIIGNMRLLIARGTKIAIRLNLDRKKLETTPRLLEFLRAENIVGHANVTVYATPLHDNLCEVDATDFLGMDGLADQVFKFGIDLEHPVSLRANDLGYIFKLQAGQGLLRTSFCMQTRQNTLVIDPYGDLYACFEEAGNPDRRVGHLGNDGVEFFPLRERYMTRHLANLDECLACPVALTCGGQCGVMCQAKTGDLFKPYCGDMKKVILKGLKHAYIKHKMTAAATAGVPAAQDTGSLHG